jgi:hypothetical protein
MSTETASSPEQSLLRAKTALLKRLKRRRITLVEIGYDGEGDDGQIHDVAAYDRGQKPVALDGNVRIILGDADGPLRARTLHAVLEEFAWLLLSHYHGGFENNEGGCGSIVIDVVKGRVTLDHNDRIIEYCNRTTEV